MLVSSAIYLNFTDSCAFVLTYMTLNDTKKIKNPPKKRYYDVKFKYLRLIAVLQVDVGILSIKFCLSKKKNNNNAAAVKRKGFWNFLVRTLKISQK